LCGLSRDMMINGYFTIMSIYGINGLENRRQRQPTNYKNQHQRKIIGIGLFYYNFVVFGIYKVLIIK
jgi:hypothetical protein